MSHLDTEPSIDLSEHEVRDVDLRALRAEAYMDMLLHHTDRLEWPNLREKIPEDAPENDAGSRFLDSRMDEIAQRIEALVPEDFPNPPHAAPMLTKRLAPAAEAVRRDSPIQLSRIIRYSLENGKFDLVESLLTFETEKDGRRPVWPDDPLARYGLACVAQSRGDFDEAIDLLTDEEGMPLPSYKGEHIKLLLRLLRAYRPQQALGIFETLDLTQTFLGDEQVLISYLVVLQQLGRFQDIVDKYVDGDYLLLPNIVTSLSPNMVAFIIRALHEVGQTERAFRLANRLNGKSDRKYGHFGGHPHFALVASTVAMDSGNAQRAITYLTDRAGAYRFPKDVGCMHVLGEALLYEWRTTKLASLLAWVAEEFPTETADFNDLREAMDGQTTGASTDLHSAAAQA